MESLQPSQHEEPKPGIKTRITVWMIALPFFACFMAFVTEKAFYGNKLWEALRSTGNSTIS